MTGLLLAAVLAGVEGPTWDSDVREIMSTHCTVCHAPGRAGPFPLVTVEDVSSRAQFIAEVTERKIMPPWLPSDEGLALSGVRGLSREQIETLRAWAAVQHPVGADGAPATVPPLQHYEEDFVVAMPEPWTMDAEGGENWGRRDRDKWTFVIPIGNAVGINVRGFVHHTSVPGAVHAVTFLADATGAARYADEITDGPGHYMHGDARGRPTGELGASAVGRRAFMLPEGFHWEVPARSDLVMETHFRPSGRSHELRERVGFLVSRDSESRPVRTAIAMAQRIDLPAGESTLHVDELVLPVDVHLLAMLPRATGICTAIRITAAPPGLPEQVLLDLPDYDPHWREAFQPVDPHALPTGSIIRTTFRIENTTENSRNPFLPLDRLALARRTGAVSVLLHLAADDPEGDKALIAWHKELMHARLR